jgi:TetR/AcrR family transcriptional repressor of nem operon
MAETGARERILEAAERLVLRQGFGSTTVDSVLAAAGASKGAFFHHFPSKGALGRALVQRYAARDADMLETVMAGAEARADAPAEQLVAFVRALEDGADEALAVQPGCLFVSFIYEADLVDPATRDLVRRSIRHWRERIREKLDAALGEAAEALDTESLADHVFTVIEGAFLLARALDEPTAMRRQLVHLRRYLELLFGLPAPPTRVSPGDRPARTVP